MWRFFLRQIVADKQVLDDFWLNGHILLSQSARYRLIAQGWVLDLFHQDRNRLGWRRLPATCIQRPAALPLLAVNRFVRTEVNEASLGFLPPELRMPGKCREK
jgi:hypothetical protein